ncbi:hypothetical protein DFS34DRAFT_624861 [Phlyctochytrium arcticum]|nr:hypothetical protein DFS34DRAFT_624861 [Phlyctochytrium arcticum]
MPQLTTQLHALLHKKNVLPSVPQGKQSQTVSGPVVVLPNLRSKNKSSAASKGIVSTREGGVIGLGGQMTILDDDQVEGSDDEQQRWKDGDEGMVPIRVAGDCGGSWEPFDPTPQMTYLTMPATSDRPRTPAIQTLTLQATPVRAHKLQSFVKRANTAVPTSSSASSSRASTPRASPSPSIVGLSAIESRPRSRSTQPTRQRATSISSMKEPLMPARLPRMHTFSGWEKTWDTP